MIQIPCDALSPDVLTALIEEFVSRDGTDLSDASVKIAQVRTQLKSGHVIIVYDEETESANIVAKDYRPPAPKARESREIIYDEPAPPDPYD